MSKAATPHAHVELLEDRRLLSASIAAVIPIPITIVARSSTGSTHVTRTANESLTQIPGDITPAPTLTVRGAAASDSTAPTPVITILGATGEGPHTVFVHALDSVLGSGTPLTARYVWDFGDSGSEYDTLVGWNAAHTYNNPGTYKITLTLTNQLGKVSTLSATVTVQAPNRRVIYVDSVSGSDTNNGLSPQRAIRTVDQMIRMLHSNTEIRFNGGETFNVDQSVGIPFENVQFDSYGSGNAILMRVAGTGSSMLGMYSNSVNIVIENLTFDSIWKPVGVIANKIPADGIFPAGIDSTIHNCTFLNLDVAIDDDRNPQGTIVQDCNAPLATGLRGVFIWGQGTDQVYLHNYVANSTREHDVRTVWVERELIAFNNLTNLDRSNLGDTFDNAKGTIDVHRGSYAYVADNYLYGGELRIGPRRGPGAVPGDTSQWCVFEGNHTFGHYLQIYPGTYHVMIRNNIISMEGAACISIVPSNPAGDNILDISIINNTGITNGDYGKFINISAGGTARSITLANNLWLAPNIIPGQGGNAAVYILDKNPDVLNLSTGNVWTMPLHFNAYAAGGINYVWPTWLPPHGYYTPKAWNALSFVHNDYFTRTAVSSDYTPLSGSLAATSALRVFGIFADANGKLRPANGHWSAGALQI